MKANSTPFTSNTPSKGLQVSTRQTAQSHRTLRFLMICACLLITAFALLAPANLRAQETVTIGTGTTTYHFAGYWGWSYNAWIYTPEQIGNSSADFVLNALAFQLGNVSTNYEVTHEVWLKAVPASTTFASSNTFSDFTLGATKIVDYATLSSSDANTWKNFNFSSFNLPAGQALLVMHRAVSPHTTGGSEQNFVCTTISTQATGWTYKVDSSDPGTSATGTPGDLLPNIRLTYTAINNNNGGNGNSSDLLCEDITIGTGTSTTYDLPINNYYKYTYSQTIYTAAELGTGLITAIGYQYYYSSSSTRKNNVKIYMNTVNKSSYSSGSDYVADAGTLVYQGDLNCSTGWNTFTLQTPYSYDGSGNLIVTIIDNSGGYDGSSYTFYYTSASNMAVSYRYDSGSAMSTPLPIGEPSLRSFRANTRFSVCREVVTEPDAVCGNLWGGAEAVGTEENPYIISDEAGLACLREQVNNGVSYVGSHFQLANDITLSATFNGAVTVPIGAVSSTPFRGKFHGNNHTISGLNISYNGPDHALFGYTSGATIEDLTIEGRLTGTTNLAGLIANASNTTITNCTSRVNFNNSSYNENNGGLVGSATACTITNCTYNPMELQEPISGSFQVGGIVGMATNTTITGCHNNGNIYALSTKVGGIVGYATTNSAITNCHNTGNISTESYNAGGVVGYLYGGSTIANCTNRGAITGTGSSTTYTSSGYGVGGVVGAAYYSTSASTLIVKGCHNYGTIRNSSAATGGVIGNYYGYGKIEGCNNYGTVTATSTSTKAYAVGGVIGTAYFTSRSSYNYIDSCENHAAVSGYGYVGGIAGYSYYAYYQRHNTNTANITSTGGDHTGGLFGKNHGYYYADYNSNKGNVSAAGAYVGGINGYSDYSSAKYCQYNHNSGNITSTSNYVGGINGYSYYTYTDYCVNTGRVSSSVNALAYVGGIDGNTNSFSYVRYCLNAGKVTGYNYVGGINGYVSSYSYCTYNLNVGQVAGTGDQSLTIGAIHGYAGGFTTNNYWDNQMCTIGRAYGTTDGNYSSYGRATSSLISQNTIPTTSYWSTTTGLYPRPNMAKDSAIAYVAATPIILSGDENVTNTELCFEANKNYLTANWTSSDASVVTIVDDWSSINKCYVVGTGDVTLTATRSGVTKEVDLSTTHATATCFQAVYPANRTSEIEVNDVYFEWEAMECTPSYNIYIGTTPTFSEAQQIALPVALTATTYSGNLGLESNTQYYWWILPSTANTTTCEPATFTTACAGAIPTFTVSAPASTCYQEVEIEVSDVANVDEWTASEGITIRDGRFFANPNVTTEYIIYGHNDECLPVPQSVTINVDAPTVSLVGTDGGDCMIPGTVVTINNADARPLATTADQYQFSVSQRPFEPITGSAATSGDDEYTVVNIGFTFNYCGVDYTQATVATNGFLKLGNGTNAYGATLNSSTYYNYLSAMTADIEANELIYTTTGTAPNRVFTMQHYGQDRQATSNYFYYQIKLYETTNKIEFHYGDNVVNSTKTNYQIGINNYTNGVLTYQSVTPTGVGTATTSTSSSPGNTIQNILVSGTVYTFSPGAILTYAWNNGEETGTITVYPEETTTYTVTVSSSENTCNAIVPYTIHVNQTITVTPNEPMVCPNGTVDLTATGADNYEWICNDNVVATTATCAASVPATVADAEYMVVGISDDGCRDTVRTLVTTFMPEYANAGMIEADDYCVNDNVITIQSEEPATGGGNVEYRFRIGNLTTQWSQNPNYILTAADRDMLGTGTFTVYRDYRDACGSEGSTDRITLEIAPLPAAPTVAGETTILCGDNTTLRASAENTTDLTVFRWYADPECTQLVYEGQEVEMENLTQSVTYYLRTEQLLPMTPFFDFDYTGAPQTFTVQPNMESLLLEVWGAQGGGQQINQNSSLGLGGRGGYSIGTLPLQGNETISVFVGGQGNAAGSGIARGGWNGGGTSWGSGTNEPAGGGGGATDIRINGNSLYHRVIVAGGGGGGGEDSEQGGYGGGTTGGGSTTYAATQTGTPSSYGGTFGYAANTSYDGGAGGGGWYGAGAAGGSQTIPNANNSSDSQGASGGSGYVYTASTAVNYPEGCMLNSRYFLQDAQTIAGNTVFPAPDGTTETGHSGNGYARITPTYNSMTVGCNSEVAVVNIIVEQIPTPQVEVISACEGAPSELRIVDPQQDLVYQWSYDPDFAQIEYTGTVIYPTVQTETNIYVRAGRGLGEPVVVNLDYTGAEQQVIVPDGTNRAYIQVWGAQGGTATNNTEGGHGGYAEGTLAVGANTDLYVNVGGAGTYGSTAAGGFNGGGNARSSNNRVMASGGGATDVRVNGNSLYHRVIVAGGGGGSYESGVSGTGATVSYGGGLLGGTASHHANSGVVRAGAPGSQTAGGAARAETGWDASYISTILCGSFGQGGGAENVNTQFINGGGGGWYGGGAGGPDGGAGGGSGYVYTESTAVNYPEGCMLNSSYYLQNAQTIAGNTDFLAPDGTNETGHIGNGYARITFSFPDDEIYCITETATVTLNPVALPTYTLTPDFDRCPSIDETTTIAVTNPSADIESYAWSTGETTNSIAVNPGYTTEYVVSVSNGLCYVTDTVTISVDAPSVSLVGTDNGFCMDSGTEVTIGNADNRPLVTTADQYYFSVSQRPYEPITGAAGPTGDSGSGSYEFPFTFNYCGRDFTSVYVSTNGYIYLGGQVNANCELRTFAADLNATAMSYTTLGTAPNRVFVVQFEGHTWNNSSAPYTYQVRLYESTNIVEYHYGDGFTDISAASYTYKIDIRGPINANRLCVQPTGIGTAITGSNEVNVSMLEANYLVSGTVYTFSPGDNYTYAWSNGEETGIITVYPEETTTYTVTVTSPTYTCSAILDYTVRVNPVATFVSVPERLCDENDQATITAIGADNYRWEDGTTTASITANGVGVYAVTATNNDGCFVEMEYELSTANITEGTIRTETHTICQSETGDFYTLSLEDGVSINATMYRWKRNGEILQNPTTTDEGSNYTVSATEIQSLEPGTYVYTREVFEECDQEWVTSNGSLTLEITPALPARHVVDPGNGTVVCGNNGMLYIDPFYQDPEIKCYWYEDAACTQLYATGDTVIVPNMLESKTLYLKAQRMVATATDNYVIAPNATPIDFPYTGGEQTYTCNEAGLVQLEVWGAQGGSYSSYYGGKGGYSKGILEVEAGRTLYISVGEQPATNSTTKTTTYGGWNGGGDGFNRDYSDVYTYGQGGGGATHIATASGVLSSLASYQSAVKIVAGGGGGSAGVNAATTKYGGGTTGGNPSGYTGVAGGQSAVSPADKVTAGTFGQGANTTVSGNNYKYGSGGGGGGWYGGGACSAYSDSDSPYRNYNGGGSGYIGGVTNAQTIAGNQSFPAPAGGTETGHSGHGYARITPVIPEIVSVPQGCPSIPQAFTLTVTQPESPQVADETTYCGVPTTLAVQQPNPNYHYVWSSTPEFTDTLGTGTTLTVQENTGTYNYYVKSYYEARNTITTDFGYTGTVQEYQVPANAREVAMELWGAQGGYNSYEGGKGGYSYGKLNDLSNISQLYVYVGQKPANGTYNSGGWNGGGKSNNYGAGGGGSTDVALYGTNGSTTWNDAYHFNSRLIVAGAGGGAGYASTHGGFAGGTNGGQGDNGSATGGYGASLTAGGSNNAAGLFGYANISHSNNGGGGGGGWYGGASGMGSGTDAGGGGGSGYAWCSQYASYAPSSYTVSANYYLSDVSLIAGNTEFPAPDGTMETGHSGNGYARITAYVYAYSCESPVATITLNVEEAPAPQLDNETYEMVCGEDITFTVNDAQNVYTYTWYADAQLTQQLGTGDSYTATNVTEPMNIYVQSTFATDNGGLNNECTSPVTSAEITFLPIETPEVIVPDMIPCGSKLILFVNDPMPGFNYYWFTDAACTQLVHTGDTWEFAQLENLESRTYYVKAGKNAAGSGRVETQDFEFNIDAPEAYNFAIPEGIESLTFQLWGAQGSSSITGEPIGGFGGYTEATLSNFDNINNIAIFVGGEASATTNGWNECATDIRINGTDITNRILMAGSGNTSNYVSDLFTNVTSLTGYQEMPDIYSTPEYPSYESGHHGNGYARISIQYPVYYSCESEVTEVNIDVQSIYPVMDVDAQRANGDYADMGFCEGETLNFFGYTEPAEGDQDYEQPLVVWYGAPNQQDYLGYSESYTEFPIAFPVSGSRSIYAYAATDLISASGNRELSTQAPQGQYGGGIAVDVAAPLQMKVKGFTIFLNSQLGDNVHIWHLNQPSAGRINPTSADLWEDLGVYNAPYNSNGTYIALNNEVEITAGMRHSFYIMGTSSGVRFNANSTNNQSVIATDAVLGVELYSGSGSTQLSFPPISSGNAQFAGTVHYELIGETRFGCMSEDAYEISLYADAKSSMDNARINILNTDTLICSGGSLELEVIQYEAGDNATLSWVANSGNGFYALDEFEGQSQIEMTFDETTVIGVFLASTNCDNTDTVFRTIRVLQPASLVDAFIESEDIICRDYPLTLTLQDAFVDGNVSYVWFERTNAGDIRIEAENSNQIVVNPSSSTTYGVYVTSGYCPTTDEITKDITVSIPSDVTAATITNRASDVICQGDTAFLTINNVIVGETAEYVWFANDGTAIYHIANNTNYIEVTPFVTTTYGCYMASDYCNNSDTIYYTIEVSARPIISLISADTICAPEALHLDVIVDYNGYESVDESWECSEDGENFVPFTANDNQAIGTAYHNWYIRYSASSTCSTSKSNAVQIVVDTLGVFETLPTPDPICDGSTFNWTANSTEIYYTNFSNRPTRSGWNLFVNGNLVPFDENYQFSYQSAEDYYQYNCYFITGCDSVVSNTVNIVTWKQPELGQIMQVGAVCAGNPIQIVAPTVTTFGTDGSHGWEYASAATASSFTQLGADPIIDYSLNNKYIRYYLESACGVSVSNSVQVPVYDRPYMAAIDAMEPVCSNTLFEVVEPEITDEGGLTILSQGWYLFETEEVEETTAPVQVQIGDMMTAEMWNGKWLRYGATNDCGTRYSNAVPLTVHPAHNLRVLVEKMPYGVVSETQPVTIGGGCFGPDYRFTAVSDLYGVVSCNYRWSATNGANLDAENTRSVISQMPDPGTITYTVTVTENEYGCAATESVVFNVVENYSDTSVTICKDDLPYVYDPVNKPTDVFTESGNYELIYPTAIGCDSVVTLHLTVHHPLVRRTDIDLCDGENTVEWRGQTIEFTGERLHLSDTIRSTTWFSDLDFVYDPTTQSYVHTEGCDSLIFVLNVTASDNPTIAVSQSEMTGNTGETLETKAQVQQVCSNSNSRLAIAYKLFKDDELIDDLGAYGQVYVGTYLPSNNYTFGNYLPAASGELPADHFIIDRYPYDFFYAQFLTAVENNISATWNEPGEYKMELVLMERGAANAVDFPMHYRLPDPAAPNGYRWIPIGGGQNVGEIARTYLDTIYVYFHVGATDDIVVDTTVCANAFPIEFHAQTIEGEGSYEIYTGSENQFTRYLLNVTAAPIDTTILTMATPDAELIYEGNAYGEGVHTIILTGDNGCDSVIRLTVVANQLQNADTLLVVACNEYEWNGQTYTTSGDYTIAGVDQVLRLTILHSANSTDELHLSQHQLPYTYGPMEIPAFGEYSVFFPTDGECDSIVYLNVIQVNPLLDIDTNTFAANIGETNEFVVNVEPNGLDEDMKLAVDYEIIRNGEIIDNIGRYGQVRLNTYYQALNRYFGVNAATGIGSIPGSNFVVINNNYDYFYSYFFETAKTQVMATWNVPGEYKIRFFLREREGGQDRPLRNENGPNSRCIGGAGSQNAYLVAFDSVVMNYTGGTITETVTESICETEISDTHAYNYRGFAFTTTNEGVTITNTATGVTENVAYTTTNPRSITTDLFLADAYQTYDTIVNYNLVINPVYNHSYEVYLCEGNAYQDDYFTLTAAEISRRQATGETTLTRQMTTAAGCDSVVELTLHVIPTPTVRIRVPDFVCAGNDVPVTATVTSPINNGNVILTNIAAEPRRDTIRARETVTYQTTFTAPETDFQIFVTSYNVVGTATCTATDTARIIVLPFETVTYRTAAICQGEAYDYCETGWNECFSVSAEETEAAIDNDNRTPVVITRRVVTATNECGSFYAELALTVNPRYDAQTPAVVEDEVCEGYGYNNYGFDLSADDLAAASSPDTEYVTFTQQTTSSLGCDSVTALRLHIRPSEHVYTTDRVCGYRFPIAIGYAGSVYLIYGYGDTTIVARLLESDEYGCDRIGHYTIVVDTMPEFEVSGNTNICENGELSLSLISSNAESIRWYVNDQVVSTDMAMTAAVTANDDVSVSVSDSRCTQTQEIPFTIVPAVTTTESRAVCERDLPYEWNGVQFATADTVSVTLQAANGCDSVVTMQLTLVPTSHVDVYESITSADLPFEYNGVTFPFGTLVETTREFQLQSVAGCDSIVTLHLTIDYGVMGDAFILTSMDEVDTTTAYFQVMANGNPQGKKVAVAYTLYKDDVPVELILTECGGDLNVATAFRSDYVGAMLQESTGWLPKNTFRLASQDFDYLYLAFWNGRMNKITHSFTEAGTYRLVLDLYEMLDGTDIQLYNDGQLIGGEYPNVGSMLATKEVVFEVAGSTTTQPETGMPTLSLTQSNVTTATSSVNLSVINNAYNSDARVSIRYTVYEVVDGEEVPVSMLSNIVNMNFATKFDNRFYGSTLTNGAGSIPQLTFRPVTSMMYNYFYLYFLENTQNRIEATWFVPGNYNVQFDLMEMKNGQDLGLVTAINGVRKRIGGKSATEDQVLATTTLQYRINQTASNPIAAGIEESDDIQDVISLYPNPANDHVVLTLGAVAANADITITDATGKVVYRTAATNNRMELNVTTWTAGVYFVTISDDNQVVTKKLVVTK